jgi:hypothetical protein
MAQAMNTSPHDLAVELLRQEPGLLGLLVEKLLGRKLPVGLQVADSSAHFVKTEEVRPDLALEGDAGWAVVEVQGQSDPEKRRRWLMMLAVKMSQAGRMGDLIVLTHRRSVARWAAEVAQVRGPMGTRLELVPLVLLVTEANLGALLDPEHPALAFFAAWAMQDRHGEEAQQVVRSALELSERLPEPLQAPMWDAILRVLNERMLVALKESLMDFSHIPLWGAAKKLHDEGFHEGKAEGKAEGEAKGKAEGKAEAVLAILTSRGLAISESQREHILGCLDLSLLDQYLQRALTATATEQLFT